MEEGWEEWKKRPARRQVDEKTLAREMAAKKGSGGDTNIWSGRSLNRPGPWEPREREKKQRSKYRCQPQFDSGRTRGSDANQHTFCWYFAKGNCSQGSACPYLHRVPTEEDEAYHVKDLGMDIFGREKRGEAEGYRKGAGTFERDNRVLYINYEGAGCYDVPRIRQLLQENFGQWGKIESIYIVHAKTIAFIRFAWRSSAEFAKEAMHNQGLVGSTQSEVLTIRWSNEDPNPVAAAKVKREYKDAFAEAALSSWEALPEEQKRARIMQLQLMSSLRKGAVVSDYPDTDNQFITGGPQAGAGDAYPNTDDQYGQAHPDTEAHHTATTSYPNTDDQYAQADHNAGAQRVAGARTGDGTAADGQEAEARAAGTTGYGAYDASAYQGSGYEWQAWDPAWLQDPAYAQYYPQYWYQQSGQGGPEEGGHGEVASAEGGTGGVAHAAGGQGVSGQGQVEDAGTGLALLAGYGSGSESD